MCDNKTIEIIKLVLVLFFTIVGILIAYQQYKLNKYKVRLDLYDKRYAIYLGYKKIIITLLKYGTLKDDELNEYLILTKAAPFLFEEEILSHFNEVYNKFVKIIEYQAQINNNIEDSSFICDANLSQIFNYFRQLILEADKKYFDKYLNFSKLKY